MMTPKVVEDTQSLLLKAINKLTSISSQLYDQKDQYFPAPALEKFREASELIRDGMATLNEGSPPVWLGVRDQFFDFF
ncbi:hypothetical protein SBOR_8995 [Sclerotinia borealis F-4128]|uniref:Uncharacterized protein n=1 Tax=Sclerotinia borealis (strain F-4128) TaxID=1432307 RepID=W9C1E4_SCLBF|nr:hypothetical protein SBOR_8995 [Sclerotinia borealis F-4128]